MCENAPNSTVHVHKSGVGINPPFPTITKHLDEVTVALTHAGAFVLCFLIRKIHGHLKISPKLGAPATHVLNWPNWSII